MKHISGNTVAAATLTIGGRTPEEALAYYRSLIKRLHSLRSGTADMHAGESCEQFGLTATTLYVKELLAYEKKVDAVKCTIKALADEGYYRTGPGHKTRKIVFLSAYRKKKTSLADPR